MLRLCAISFLLSLPCIALAQTLTNASNPNQGAPAVIQGLKNNSVIPQILPNDFTPSVMVAVEWDTTGAAPIEFAVGANLTQQDVSISPNLTLIEDPTAVGPGKKPNPPSTSYVNLTGLPFLIVMFDPDAKQPFLHWIGKDYVTTIANAQDNGTSVVPWPMANRSAAIAEYIPPSPPAGDPPHRYVVAVYKQPSLPLNIPASFADIAPRMNFNLTNFVSETNLSIVGASLFYVSSNSTTASSTSISQPGSPISSVADGSTPTPSPTAPSGSAPASSSPSSAQDLGRSSSLSLYGTILSAAVSLLALLYP